MTPSLWLYDKIRYIMCSKVALCKLKEHMRPEMAKRRREDNRQESSEQDD